MYSFDLDTKLMQFGTGNTLSKPWCIRHSLLGIQAFGSNGGGKSSSMKTVALKLLRAGYGFLILSAKSERETWEEYCRLAGRSDDLVIIGPDSSERFDFMKYLSTSRTGAALTRNLFNLLKSVIAAGDETGDGKSSDPFWEKSLNLLIYHSILLNQLAYNEVSVQTLYDLVQSAPAGSDEESGQKESTSDPNSAFNKAFEKIRSELAGQYQKWQKSWSKRSRTRFEDKAVLEAEMMKKFPKARQFKFVEQFFFETFKTLSHKTKSVILLSVSNFLFHLLQDPIYSLFCNGEVTVTPEHSLNGSVVLLDLPTKHYFEAGRSAQLIYKLIWQRQLEARNIKANNPPGLFVVGRKRGISHGK